MAEVRQMAEIIYEFIKELFCYFKTKQVFIFFFSFSFGCSFLSIVLARIL